MTFAVQAQEYVADHPVASLRAHPDNPRQGDDGAVAASVDALGWYGAVIVQRSTGYVLAGNTRLRVALDAGMATLPAMVLDVDDDTAKRILLADNRTGDVAVYDQQALLELLSQLDDLTGTGYDITDMDDLAAALEEANHVEPEQVGVAPTDGEHPYAAPGDQHGTNMQPAFDERLDKYRKKAVRSVVLDYQLDTYEQLAANLAWLRDHLSVPTNADVVLHLVNQATAAKG